MNVRKILRGFVGLSQISILIYVAPLKSIKCIKERDFFSLTTKPSARITRVAWSTHVYMYNTTMHCGNDITTSFGG